MIGAAMRTAARRVPFRMVARSGGMHARCLSLSDPATIDPSMLADGIQLLVCDMAGTTVEEHGAVYKVLRQSMVQHGLQVPEADMHEWHGAAKGAVVRHFLEASGRPFSNADAEAIDRTFESEISRHYALPGSVDFIHTGLPRWLAQCRAAGVQVGLNTGYPRHIQDSLLDGLGLGSLVDHSISAAEVSAGRPAPFMVHRLMEAANVTDVAQVAKAGDTINDVLEGRNAGCGLVIGVSSGADSEMDLWAAGADIVVPNITAIKVEWLRCYQPEADEELALEHERVMPAYRRSSFSG
jgi:phosphoglycolate phosphatase